MWNNQTGDIDWGPTCGVEKVLVWNIGQREKMKWPQWSPWVSFWNLVWGQGGGQLIDQPCFPKNMGCSILDRLNIQRNRICWQGWTSFDWVHDTYIQMRGILSLLGGHTTCGRHRHRGMRRSKSEARCLIGVYDEIGKEVSSLIIAKGVGKHSGR